MRKYIKYGVTLLIGLIAAFIICCTKGIFSKKTLADVYHILTDAFFVPGVIILCFGLLVFASNEGNFTMMSYGIKRFFSLFKRDISKELGQTYADYKLAHKGEKHPILYLLICGGVLIVISILFLFLYYDAR